MTDDLILLWELFNFKDFVNFKDYVNVFVISCSMLIIVTIGLYTSRLIAMLYGVMLFFLLLLCYYSFSVFFFVDYEDKKMNKNFLELKYKKIKENNFVFASYNIRNAKRYEVEFINNGVKAHLDLERDSNSCLKPNWSFLITKTKVFFDSKDIEEIGKAKMFEYAMNCFDRAIKEVSKLKKKTEKNNHDIDEKFIFIK